MYAFSLYKCSYREDSLGWGERDRGKGVRRPRFRVYHLAMLHS